jgi:hypothetical protein
LLGRHGQQVRHGAGDERRVTRFGCRPPRLVDTRQDGAAARVEEPRHQVGAGDAVDHAVVDLGDQRPSAAGETLDHPGLPERSVPIELDRHELRHQVVQLFFSTRSRQRRVTDVVGEVEVRVVDPHRSSELTGYEPHLLAVPR